MGEWPWTYFFLLVLLLMFGLQRSSRSLGIDAIIAARSADARTQNTLGRFCSTLLRERKYAD